MPYTREELYRKFITRDFTGLHVAGLVRLSFEHDYEKKRKRPSIILTGADINGRNDQEDRVTRETERLGGTYVFTYDEPNTSAWKRRRVILPDGSEEWRVKRDRLDKALIDLKAHIAENGMPFDVLMVYNLDRLTRDGTDLRRCIDVQDHYPCIITDMHLTLDLFSAMGKGNAKFMVDAKDIQSSDTATRVRDKHETMAQAGIPVGGSRPFGWNEDKRTLNPVESELLRKARTDILFGIGLHTICREWTESDIKTPKGNKWSHQVLKTMLLNPRLAGYRIYQGKLCLGREGQPVMGQYEAVFNIPEWKELRDYLTQDGRGGGTGHTGARKYLLSGIVRCGLCGAKCRGRWDNRLNVHHYACPSPTDSSSSCGKVSINGAQLDAMVTEQLLAMLAEVQVKPTAQPWPDADALAAKEAQIKELMDAYGAQELPKEHVFPLVTKLTNEVSDLKRERTKWNRKQSQSTRASSNVIQLWPSMETDRKRAVVETVIQTVAIKARLNKRPRFDADRVEIVKRELDLSTVAALIMAGLH